MAPQNVADKVKQLTQKVLEEGGISSALPPMIVLASFSAEPHPLAAGMLAPCEDVLEISDSLRVDSTGKWIILPVKCGRWFDELRRILQELSGQNTFSGLHEDVIQAPDGILIGHYVNAAKNYRLNREPTFPSLRWRALNMVCFEVQYSVNRPLSKCLYLQEIWKRRLRRAPGGQEAEKIDL